MQNKHESQILQSAQPSLWRLLRLDQESRILCPLQVRKHVILWINLIGFPKKSCVGACISMLSSFRSNCFGSEVFAYCMGELLVATDMKKQIDTLRESIHGSSFLHKWAFMPESSSYHLHMWRIWLSEDNSPPLCWRLLYYDCIASSQVLKI